MGQGRQPDQDLKDAGEGKTIAFSSPGSSSNLILLTLLKQLGSKAKPTPTGGVPGTYTQTMTGQIDIGWSVVPFALKDVNDGKVRIVARASDATELKDQTIRANLASVNALKNRRETIVKFMQVIQKSIDWAYGPGHDKAIEIFAKNMKVTPEIAKQAVDGFFPKSAMQIGEIKDLDRSLQDALDFKFIASPKKPPTSPACLTSSTSRNSAASVADRQPGQGAGNVRKSTEHYGGVTFRVPPPRDISTTPPQYCQGRCYFGWAAPQRLIAFCCGVLSPWGSVFSFLSGLYASVAVVSSDRSRSRAAFGCARHHFRSRPAAQRLFHSQRSGAGRGRRAGCLQSGVAAPRQQRRCRRWSGGGASVPRNSPT